MASRHHDIIQMVEPSVQILAVHGQEPIPLTIISSTTVTPIPPPDQAVKKKTRWTGWRKLINRAQCKTLLLACLALFGAILVLAIVALPLAEVAIGAIYSDKEYCPSERIALLLIIGGCFSITAMLLECCCSLQGEKGKGCGSLGVALIAWLIAAAVIVYRFYGKVSYENNDAGNYCHPILYRFLFWKVTIALGFVGFSLLVGCCAAVLRG